MNSRKHNEEKTEKKRRKLRRRRFPGRKRFCGAFCRFRSGRCRAADKPFVRKEVEFVEYISGNGKKLALAAGLTAFGQNESSFGVRAGLNVANLHLSAGGLSASLDSRASYHVGFAYQQPLLRVLPLYFETGLYLSGRGASVTAGDLDLDVEGKAKFNMLYLQVPAVVSWHFNIKSVSIQPAAGVYYGFGIHGKLKGDAAKVDLFKEISVPVEDGSVEGQVFKRSDFGLRFGVGVTVMKHYYAGVGYDLGLLNISKDSGEGKIKNGSFFISLGYNF